MPARISYLKYDVAADQRFVVVDETTSSEYYTTANVQFAGILWTQNYALQVKGADGLVKSNTYGFVLDLATAPTDLVMCATDDESTVPTNISIYSVPPSGCQTPQIPNKIRFFWGAPINNGHVNNDLVSVLSWEIEWSTDETFYTGVTRESCVRPESGFGVTTADGGVCNYWYQSAQIPSNGTLLEGVTYYVRVAMRNAAGVGQWTTPTIAPPIPVPVPCAAGYTGSGDESCTACEANTYKPVNGSAACTACPSNTFSAVGSDSLTDCVCSGGYFRI